MSAKLVVDLRSLQIFTTVAESGNMTTAAKRLQMTQPAVSQAIRQLESILAVSLVDRRHRPLKLTAAGHALFRSSETIIEHAESLPAVVREADSSLLPEIRIGLVDSFAGTAGPEFVKALANSATRISIWTGLSPSLGEALHGRQVDLIISTDSLDDFDGLHRHLLWQEPFVLVLPKRAVWTEKAHSLRELARDSQMIRYSGRSHLGGQIDRHLRRQGLSIDRRVEIDISDTLLAMVAAEIGWAVTTPLCLLQGRQYAEQLKVVRMPGPGFVRSMSLVSRENEYRDLSKKIAQVAKDILRHECLRAIKRTWPWLAGEIKLP